MGQDSATHNGEPWGQLYLALADFGSNEGFVAVGSRDSSGNLRFKVDTSKTIADFGAAEGWSGSTEQSVRALGTVAVSGTTASHSDLILSGASNTQIWHFT